MELELKMESQEAYDYFYHAAGRAVRSPELDALYQKAYVRGYAVSKGDDQIKSILCMEDHPTLESLCRKHVSDQDRIAALIIHAFHQGLNDGATNPQIQ